MTRNGFRFCTEDQALDAYYEWKNDRFGIYFIHIYLSAFLQKQSNSIQTISQLQTFCLKIYNQSIERYRQIQMNAKQLSSPKDFVISHFSNNAFEDYNSLSKEYRFVHSFSRLVHLMAFVERYASVEDLSDLSKRSLIEKQHYNRLEEARQMEEIATSYDNCIRVLSFVYRKLITKQPMSREDLRERLEDWMNQKKATAFAASSL